MILTRKVRLDGLSDVQIVDRFVLLAYERRAAFIDGKIRRNNHLVDRLRETFEELAKRPGERWRLLLPLLKHPHVGIRLHAASFCLSGAPELCVPVLRLIESQMRSTDALDAWWALKRAGYGELGDTLAVNPPR